MSAFVLADIEIHDPAGYREYIEKVPDLVAKHGGVYRARGGGHTCLEGDWEPKRLVLLEFPDRSNAEAFYDDPDYQSLKQIRQNTTKTNLVLFDGL
ncbi:MAG: DUF1330 domain-containing protein [Verrucomicrobia bacterium]|nr:DUF1330 domain-containing protein [Verrucomicrobiota bacterium]